MTAMTAMTERDRLVEENLGLVEGLAGKLLRTIGRTVEFEDLVGYGRKGLCEAADRYDAKHGAAFTTFAYYRIRGAMFDGLRTMGWYSRGDYARYKAEERANELLTNTSDREAAGQQAATGNTSATTDREGILGEIADTLSRVAAVHITSMAAADAVADERTAPPDSALHSARMSARVREAFSSLPDRERKLIELYYFQDQTLADAGAALGLSKSWACRLHARAVGFLRDALAQGA